MLSVLINTHMLLEAVATHKVQRFFYSSSACVYPAHHQDRPDLPALKEDDVSPASPEDGYGEEKLFSEAMHRHFMRDHGIACRVARLHNVYGPHGSWNDGREKAPAAICRKVAETKVEGFWKVRSEVPPKETGWPKLNTYAWPPIEVWGDGTYTRSFTWIEDCLEGIHRIMHSDVDVSGGRRGWVWADKTGESLRHHKTPRCPRPQQRQYPDPETLGMGAADFTAIRHRKDLRVGGTTRSGKGWHMNICVCGLGKLGSPMAAVFASKGHTVVGCDLNEEYVDKLNQGVAPVEETDLQDVLDLWGRNIRATTDVQEAAADAEIIFVIVPTPSTEDGSFSTKYVRDVLFAIAASQKGLAEYPVIVIVSTVSPGSMDRLKDDFESATGGTCGVDFGLAYNPEFIALGSVIYDLRRPDFVLVGEADKRSGDTLQRFYGTIHEAPVRRMSFASAEIAKLSLNVALTQRISYANTVSELCERTPGASATNVLSAIGLDKRIGHRYLQSGTAYGGPCFPRDGRAFVAATKQAGCQAWMASAADAVNKRQAIRLADIVERETSAQGVIAIFGLTYKTDTRITEESAGLALGDELARRGLAVSLYCPGVPEQLLLLAGPWNTVVITVPWPEFRKSLPALLRQNKQDVVLIDCWDQFATTPLPAHVRRIVLGEGANAGVVRPE
jgi:UDPglucose 6-dehydrogenase